MLKRIFGSRNERILRQMSRRVQKINALETELQQLSDEQLSAKTDEFRKRFEDGETLDDLLEETFAVCREASTRTLGLRHFDVQLIGAMVLHQGKISEMRTGEGKTLMATLAVYLNALAGSVHVVTVNDYLAARDAQWMRKLYQFLKLNVGIVTANQEHEEKSQAYQCDVVYGTNNEFGFDYLRDNMAFAAEQRVQNDLSFAVVDEVDSILIDEARTPLIISGSADSTGEIYEKINAIIPLLEVQEDENSTGDYSLDNKTKQAYLTEAGHEKAEQLLVKHGLLESGGSLYDIGNISLLHYLYAGIRAHAHFHNDVDYIIKDNQIVIIDEFTGRMMPGRRWSDGLHQAIEAKEKVSVQKENQTLASITFQNYFRLYEKLSGMTGTADTEAVEFQEIYGLEVVVVPTHRSMIRTDHPDVIYRTMEEKFNAIVNDVVERNQTGQPILLGTVSIEVSERLSRAFEKHRIPHEVLNAKQHQREALVIAGAGKPGAVTIATNMAGRGTDIVLGGNLEMQLQDDQQNNDEIRKQWQKDNQTVLNSGGLYVIGTERHESRRIDNQLRGRAGRQGDPGASRFYLSLEDNLMRIFGSERITNMMQRIGMEENEAIESRMVSRVIENAQRKVEGHNFDVRKQLLEYDDVANEQRKLVYSERYQLLTSDAINSDMESIRHEVVQQLIDRSIPPSSLPELWNISLLEEDVNREFGLQLPIREWLEKDKNLHEEPLRERISEVVEQAYRDKERDYGEELMHHLEKVVMLQVLDTQWKEHLSEMDHLRQGIGLRGFAQKNPKQEYKREAFEMFTAMLDRVRAEVVSILNKVKLQEESEIERLQRQKLAKEQYLQYNHGDNDGDDTSQKSETFVRQKPKVGRNQPCPCGSGKKYKHCHGKL